MSLHLLLVGSAAHMLCLSWAMCVCMCMLMIVRTAVETNILLRPQHGLDGSNPLGCCAVSHTVVLSRAH